MTSRVVQPIGFPRATFHHGQGLNDAPLMGRRYVLQSTYAASPLLCSPGEESRYFLLNDGCRDSPKPHRPTEPFGLGHISPNASGASDMFRAPFLFQFFLRLCAIPLKSVDQNLVGNASLLSQSFEVFYRGVVSRSFPGYSVQDRSRASP